MHSVKLTHNAEPPLHITKVSKIWLGTVAHTFNSSTLVGQRKRIAQGQKVKTSLCNLGRYSLYNFFFFLTSQACWHMAIVPAPQEAEVGGSLDPRGLSLQVSCDQTTALQPGLSYRVRSTLKKSKTKYSRYILSDSALRVLYSNL